MYIENATGNKIVTGTSDKDVISNKGRNVTINALGGNDSIENTGQNVTINALGGNDYIKNSGRHVTINGGSGNDLISLGANAANNVIIYNEGDGNDKIYGFKANSTLSIAGGAASSEKSGDDIILTVGREKITLTGAANLSTVNIVETALNITNTDNYQLITGTNRNDTIKNSGAQVTINTFKGNDSISLASSASENLIIYNNGDGNDVITGFKANSTLSISGGAYTSEKSGNDIIVTVGKEKITLKGAANLSKVNIAVPVNINNYKSNITLTGNDADDTISNIAKNVMINALGGNDSIRNNGVFSTIDGGANNDSISNEGSNVSIAGGDGSDSIRNYGSQVTINADDGKDSIENYGYDVTISGGADNDTIKNTGSNVLYKYKSGDGNDFIYGFNNTSTLSIGGGIQVTTTKSGNNVIVTVGKGKITLAGAANLSKVNIAVPVNINNYKSNITLTGNDADDTISNIAKNVMINALGGNDSIRNNGVFSTIDGGEGNDKISLLPGAKENLIIYNAGDGNDTISGLDATSTLSISGGAYTSEKSGNDIIVTVGKEKITLQGAAKLYKVNIVETPMNISNADNNKIIAATNADDTISNSGQNVTINALGGNDYIENTREYVSINGGDGNDTISNTKPGRATKTTIIGGAGNDSIYNQNYSTTIDGGEGSDTISNTGNNVTINAGTGDDSISNTGDIALFMYNPGDGNDIITGFKSNSTLLISEGDYSSQISGDDVIVTIGSGQVTLKDAADLSNVIVTNPKVNVTNTADNVSIIGSDVRDTIQNKGKNVTIQAKGGDDTIDNFGSSVTVDGGEGKDYIYNSWKNTSVSIIGGAGNDSILNTGQNVTINAGDGNDSINNIGQNVTINAGTGNDYIYNDIDGDNVTINAGDGNDSIQSYSKYVTISSGAGNDLITIGGYGYGHYKNIDGGSGNDTLHNYGVNSTLDGGAGSDILFNYGVNSTLDGGAGSDILFNDSVSTNASIVGGAGDDTLHNDSSLNATVEGGEGNDHIINNADNVSFKYNYGDGDDIIEGFKANSTLDMGKSNFASVKSDDGNDLIVRSGDDEITIVGAANLSKVNINGVEDVPLVQGVGNTVSNSSIVGTNYNDTIFNVSAENVMMLALGGNDYVRNRNGANATILGQGGNDTINNESSWSTNASILGGKGNDSIRNEANDATIEGGVGDDSITNVGSNKSSLSGGAGNDFVSNSSGFSVTSSGGEGNDTIYSRGNYGKIYGGAGDDSIFIDSRSGEESIRYTSIEGGDGNDTIQNQSAGFSTIEGGKGDDLIYDVGNDALIKYVAGDGNDLITGFKENSTLSINGGVYATTVKSGNDVIVTVGDGVTTLRGAARLSRLNIIETPVNINNGESNKLIYGTNANDTIINTGNKVTISALGGDDSLNNNAASVSIDGGEHEDNISNIGKYVTILANSGNDSIYNNADKNLIDGGALQDSIFNHGEEVSINGGTSSDTIENYTDSDRSSIAGGDGSDIINNSAHNVTLSGEDGNDTISSKGTSNSISGGAGDDLISIEASYKNTLSGGKGSDTINLDWSSNSALIKYSAGDGNDLITGFNSTSTLQIGDGNDTYNKSINGDDVIITVGEDNLTLKGAAQLARFNITGVARLNVNNTENAISIIGGRLDDSVVNSGNKVTISTFAGNDTLENSGRYVTIEGGADTDYISNTKGGDFVSIDGADGNDSISASGGFRNAISGGKGDDSISLSSTEREALIKYNKGDGNDYIAGFNASSTLQLGDGTDTFSKTVRSGNVIVTTGEGKITLAGTSTLSPLNIVGSEIILGEKISNHDKNVVVNGTAGDDTIRSYTRNVTIGGNGGHDYIVSTGYNVSVNGGIGNDSILNESGNTTVRNDGESITLEGADGNDIIENRVAYVSINGGDGDDSISSYRSNNTIEGGSGNDSIYNNWNFLKNTTNYGTAAESVSFNYNFGDGDDVIYGFNNTSTLNIVGGELTSAKSGNDIVISLGSGNITLKDAANLSTVNIVHEQTETPLNIVNTDNKNSLIGTALDDTISNKGRNVTISALNGNDSIYNNSYSNMIDAGDGNDSINNEYGFYTSISGGAGNDLITVLSGSQVTVNAGKDEDQISLRGNDETLIEYKAGDGNDVIYGFDEYSTLNIAGSNFTSGKSGDNIVITVGADKITLDGAATLSNPNITNGTHVTFTIKNSAVTYESDVPESVIKSAYQFNQDSSLLSLSSALKNYTVSIKAQDAAKVKWDYGTASLSSASTLEYQLKAGKTTAKLTSKNYDDQIIFSEDATFNFGLIKTEVLKNSTITTKGAKEISLDNNSFANVTASRGSQIDFSASNITVNELPINARNGSGKVTVERRGLTLEGYGVQFADLEVAKESYFGKLAPITINYNSNEETYTIYNTACVKTLSNDFTKLTFDFRDDNKNSTSNTDKYAYYKINDVAILLEKTNEELETIEVNGSTFKVQDKEINAENIGRITLDEQITFSGTQIDYDGVITNYAHNKPVIYSLDGNEISISDAATVTLGENTKTFKCEAGTYTVNGRGFETSTDLTFTAGTSEIKIPLSDAQTEIDFDGVKVSGVSNGGEIVFDLANDKISIPNGATLNITSPDEVKLNLAAGSYTIDDKKISTDNELEITVDKDNIKVPLSANDVTINGAAITGTGEATIDNTNELFCSVLLPNGALVKNLSGSIYQLTGKDSSAYFGDANKKVQLTGDGTTYIEYYKEDTISVGINRFMFETVEIKDNDTWTIETSGTDGIDKITGITDGATVSTSTEYVEAGDLRFEVETKGAGTFNIGGQKVTTTGDAIYVVYGNSDGEIKVAPLGEEYKGDNSEAAGKTYNFDKAGDYTVNGITFNAAANTKAKTITHGVELDLSSGSFQYDGLTLSGSGTAQINRYNAKLISLTDGAIVDGSDATKYQNRQFEIEGAVELIGKKFETDKPIRCGLIDAQDTIDGQSINLRGFVVDDKYVQIQDDYYESVKVVDKKITSIEGVKASANITGNGLPNVSIVTTESGTFKIHDNGYKISGDADGVTFVMDSHGNIAEINGLQGSVEGNFENTININGKEVRLTGASSIKVTSDGEKITEISNVAGDLVTADGNTYRKNVRVYELGSAEKLTTSADGTIIFSGNKFEMSAGKTFELDNSGNVSGIEEAQIETADASANVSANVAEDETSTSPLVEENFATITLSTTNNLAEVIGDFSEGITVKGVLVKVTDSTNFVVKNDDENIYIETTAPDTFNINGKTFKTSADKTIFKLDKDGNVSEIVTDKFYLYPDEETYLIEGDFSDEVIFNGKKFCVKGTNDTTIFVGNDTLLGVELVRNAVEVVDSGGASEIVVTGGGDITIGGRNFTTSDDSECLMQLNSSGEVEKIENFIGTLSGSLSELNLEGLTINSEDNFSVTGDSSKVTAVENLQNGSVTGDNLDGITINGEKISVNDSEETTLTITDGKLKTTAEPSDEPSVNPSDTEEEFLNKLVKNNSAVVTVNADNRNVTLSGGDAVVVEDTSAKVNVTASKGRDTIYTSGNNVDIDLKAGGATEIYAAEGRATVENYKATSGAAFLTGNENIGEAIEENSIAYDDGRLEVNSARVTFAEDADSRIINFVDAAGETQKVGFVSDDSKLDASKETGSLILVGGNNSTITGGKGHNQIYLEDNGESTVALNGKNTIANFHASFDGGDKVSVSAANHDFSFDGENVSVKSGAARALIENISSDAARILTLINGKEVKTAIAQAGAVMSVGDDLADIYYGEKSGVDFSGFNDSMTIDLRENFNGINQVTVGGGLNTLISSSANETLTSNGTTEFIFDKNSGRDVLTNFDFDEDKINVGTNAVTNVRINSSGGVRMEIGGSAVLTLENAQGKNFKINNFVAIADENLTYNAEANYFVATSNNATLTVNESAEIWLDGSHGKTFSGDIRTLDASTAQGKTSLAGNDLDNTIIAGNGDSSLWGGNGGDDLLVGGTGKNTFYYLQGNGSDTITGAHDGDEVILSTVTLDQIASTSIAADSVSINFKDGGSLQVNSNANVTYQLADGSKYSANHEQATWIVK